MRKAEAHKELTRIAKELGFRSRRGKYWRAFGELTGLVELQQSRWGGGLYVNVGVFPSAFITRAWPPSSGYWGIQVRAEQIESPHEDCFCQLVVDDENEIDPATLVEPFRWLFAWVSEEFSDAEHVRRQVLDRTGLIGMMPTCVFQDWANGNLQEPKNYFGNDSYYK